MPSVLGMSNHGMDVKARLTNSESFINTEMTRYFYADEQFSAKVRARTAMGRWGNPRDLSGLMVFLSSSASDFITGESIVIDGGVTGM